MDRLLGDFGPAAAEAPPELTEPWDGRNIYRCRTPPHNRWTAVNSGRPIGE
jgi:hypothetical protein